MRGFRTISGEGLFIACWEVTGLKLINFNGEIVGNLHIRYRF